MDVNSKELSSRVLWSAEAGENAFIVTNPKHGIWLS